MHSGCMLDVTVPKAIQIRDVPDDVHAVLRVRAAKAGMSMSEYLRSELVSMAAKPTMDELSRAHRVATSERRLDSGDRRHHSRDARANSARVVIVVDASAVVELLLGGGDRTKAPRTLARAERPRAVPCRGRDASGASTNRACDEACRRTMPRSRADGLDAMPLVLYPHRPFMERAGISATR